MWLRFPLVSNDRKGELLSVHTGFARDLEALRGERLKRYQDTEALFCAYLAWHDGVIAWHTFAILGADLARNQKPTSESYRSAAEAFNLEPSQCMETPLRFKSTSARNPLKS